MPDLKALRRLRQIIADKEPDTINMDQWKCGSTACALGWACLDPEFQREGLRLEWGPSPFTGGMTWLPTYNGETCYDAGASFFGLDRDVARELFDPVTDEEWDLELTDKQAFLIRLDNLLEKHLED